MNAKKNNVISKLHNQKMTFQKVFPQHFCRPTLSKTIAFNKHLWLFKFKLINLN